MTERGTSGGMEIASTDLLEQASTELWELCTQTALDGFNAGRDGLSCAEFKKRTAQFTDRLKRFQRDCFPCRSNDTYQSEETKTTQEAVDER